MPSAPPMPDTPQQQQRMPMPMHAGMQQGQHNQGRPQQSAPKNMMATGGGGPPGDNETQIHMVDPMVAGQAGADNAAMGKDQLVLHTTKVVPDSTILTRTEMARINLGMVQVKRKQARARHHLIISTNSLTQTKRIRTTIDKAGSIKTNRAASIGIINLATSKVRVQLATSKVRVQPATSKAMVQPVTSKAMVQATTSKAMVQLVTSKATVQLATSNVTTSKDMIRLANSNNKGTMVSKGGSIFKIPPVIKACRASRTTRMVEAMETINPTTITIKVVSRPAMGTPKALRTRGILNKEAVGLGPQVVVDHQEEVLQAEAIQAKVEETHPEDHHSTTTTEPRREVFQTTTMALYPPKTGSNRGLPHHTTTTGSLAYGESDLK